MSQTYYAQRASTPGTLLISEGTFISPQGAGLAHVPGLWTPRQLAAWRRVTDAVHARGGRIFCQLWALGRAAQEKEMAKQGLGVVSASAVAIEGKGYAVPREMTAAEIERVIGEYASAARGAVEVGGFDGVEIHGANGYLVDQFTQSVSNRRTDAWGGSVERRARFALAVAKAVSDAVGRERTGIRLSPYSEFQSMRMPPGELEEQFTYVIGKLADLRLAYLHLTTPRVQGPADVANPSEDLDWAVRAWRGVSPIVLAGGYRLDSAMADVDERYAGYEVCIAFGRWFISTPDLPFRLRKGIEINKYDRSSFYTRMSAKGYVDYPFSKEWEEQQGQPRL
jgi:NADPH2 dehydrogenase